MKILANGKRSNRYAISSIINIVFDFFLNEIISNVISAKSAMPINNLIEASDSNKPNSNSIPNGKGIIDPLRKIRK